MASNRARVRTLIGELEDVINDELSRIARNILREIRNATPVDTGHAASNWIGTFGSPTTQVAGSREAVNFAPQNESLATLGRRNARLQPIFIANNVEYIGLLNTGTSTQAPRGFVEMAISRGILR